MGGVDRLRVGLLTQLDREAATKQSPEPAGHRSLVLGGLSLLSANKRLVLWGWLGSLLCGLLGTLPFGHYAGGYLNHSLATQQLAGRVDVSYVLELMQQAGKHGALNVAPALLSICVFTFFSFLLAAGALFVFESRELPRLSVVVDAGLRYFWRFARLTLAAGFVTGLTLWPLITLRQAWVSRAAETHLGRELFVRSSASFAAIVAITVLLRFFFDLAEAVVVQLGIAGDRRVRRSFRGAFTLLRGNFCRAFGGYLLAGVIGLALGALLTWIWVVALPPSATGIAFVLGQLAIASLLAGRLWQRALLACLVLQGTACVASPAVVDAAPSLEERAIW